MKNLLLLFIGTIIIWSCNRNESRIVYNESDKNIQTQDNTNPENKIFKKLIADLPFTFDNLDFLYFPIGEIKESSKTKIRSLSSSYSNSSRSYSLGYISGREVNSNLDNIMIRPKNGSTFKLLTRSEIKIKSLNYLYSIDTTHNISTFLYKIIDSDSNKDGIINDDDLIGLYSSKSDGDEFTRISPKNQQLIDWKTIDVQGLLYFRTIEDTDKNGKFNAHDRVNLYEYNLLKKDFVKLIFNNNIYKEFK